MIEEMNKMWNWALTIIIVLLVWLVPRFKWTWRI